MATRQLYATGTFKYQNRMLSAGDPVDMTATHARLYIALGKVTEKKPPRAPEPVAADTTEAAPVKKAAPRRKKAAKRAK